MTVAGDYACQNIQLGEHCADKSTKATQEVANVPNESFQVVLQVPYLPCRVITHVKFQSVNVNVYELTGLASKPVHRLHPLCVNLGCISHLLRGWWPWYAAFKE